MANKDSVVPAGSSKGQILFLGGISPVGDKQVFQYKALAARTVIQDLEHQVLPAEQALQDGQLQTTSLLVLVCSDTPVPKKTLRAVHDAVKQRRCSLLVLLGCCTMAARKRINLLLQKFQMESNGAAILSSSPQRYLHPQEVLLMDCILNRRIQQRVGQVSSCHWFSSGLHMCN